jgi:photosystem II stability/assembly factor-like uncharacterized protein
MKLSYTIAFILSSVLTFNSLVYSQYGWFTIASGTTNNLYGVSFASANTGVVVGLNGTILRTTNGGINWTPQTAPGTATHLFDVFFINDNTGWVVGDVGKIIKTTNGGALWIQQITGTPYELQSVFFSDANTGYAAGWYGTILKTTNGGTNWTLLNTGTQRNLNAISFVNVSLGFSVGLVGEVLKTTNAGISWDSIAVGTTYALENVFFANANNGNIVGENGTVYKTTNGGANWTTINFGAGTWLKDISASNQNLNVSVIIGQGGTIKKSTDGGSNWYTQVSNTGYWLNKVSFSDTSHGYAVGDNGTIIHTTTGGWLPPIAPGLVTPANNATCFSLTGTFTWNDVVPPVATSQLMIATDTGFTNVVFNLGRIVNTASGNTSYALASGILQYNTLYYWRVKDSNQVAPGPWSVRRSFRTTFAAPTVPGLVSPPNNATGVLLNAALQWDSVANASTYRTRIATDTGFANVVFDSSGIVQHSVTVPNGRLLSNTHYYWKVYASNACVNSVYSVTRNFTTIDLTGIVISNGSVPKVYKLYDNYPNPFNPATVIRFDIPSASEVSISIFDLTGKEVAKIAGGKLDAGSYSYSWNADNYPSGVYFFSMRADKYFSTKKMVLLK